MSLEFRVLGDLEVDFDGQPVDAGHVRQQCVLAALLVDANRPVPLDRLMDRVWGDRAPQRPGSAMYTYLSRLRRAFAAGGVAIARTRVGYVLTVPPETVDLHRFGQLVQQARDAGRDAGALTLWERALALWRGDAFAGLDTVWLAAVRADLDRQRLAAQLDRNDLALHLGQHSRLLTELSAAAGRHPLDERLAGQLMLAFYRCGRQGDALTHYERTRRLLADELGADPSPPLRQLHHQILTGHGALRAPATRAADQSRRQPSQLPADVSAFTGRERELSRLDGLLDAGRDGGSGPAAPTALVISAVSGTAGVGKTSLAVHWAHRVRDRFPDGQLYVNLRGYDPAEPVSPAAALANFLNALGVRGQDIPLDLDGRAGLYRSELAGRRVLLLLDNAGSAEQVRPLLPGTPTCLVLVTSRDSLASLIAVHGARRLDLDVLPTEDAISLLRALIGHRVDAEPAAALALAEMCVRLPLALRIVAEHAISRPELGLAGLAAELTGCAGRLDLLDGDDPHASVRAVFSWSYLHLPADAARVFRLLGLHPAAHLDDRAAAALAGIDLTQTRRLLAALARAHLVQHADSHRYGMHDLLRAYAAERVAHDGEDDQRTALTRLFDHYLTTAEGAARAMSGSGREELDPADARAWLDAERATLVSVSAHAARHGWDEHAVAFARALEEYLDSGGHYVDALTICTHARDAAHRLGDRAAESYMLGMLGYNEWVLGETLRAIGHLEEALALCRDLGDREGEATTLYVLGLARQRMGEHDRAGGHLRLALATQQEIGSPGEVLALRALGNLYGRQGRYRTAREHLDAALAAGPRSGQPSQDIFSLHDLAMLTAWHGPFDEAAEYAERSLALARRIHHASGETLALTGLGVAYTRLGRLDEADRHLREALLRCRRMGYRIEEIRARYNLGILCERQDRLGPAAAHLQWALARYRQTGEQPGVADAMHALGVVDTKDGTPELAARRHREAIAIFRKLGHPAGEALALNGLGEALFAAGHTQQARTEHRAALAVATRIEDRHEQARAHVGIARVCLAEGEPVSARGHSAEARDLRTALGSPD